MFAYIIGSAQLMDQVLEPICSHSQQAEAVAGAGARPEVQLYGMPLDLLAASGPSMMLNETGCWSGYVSIESAQIIAVAS